MCVLAPGDLRRWTVACRELEVPLPPFRSHARNDQEKSEQFAIRAVRVGYLLTYSVRHTSEQSTLINGWGVKIPA
jgi:hypothetical protein